MTLSGKSGKRGFRPVGQRRRNRIQSSTADPRANRQILLDVQKMRKAEDKSKLAKEWRSKSEGIGTTVSESLIFGKRERESKNESDPAIITVSTSAKPRPQIPPCRRSAYNSRVLRPLQRPTSCSRVVSMTWSLSATSIANVGCLTPFKKVSCASKSLSSFSTVSSSVRFTL